jgi:hypothetical protein
MGSNPAHLFAETAAQGKEIDPELRVALALTNEED